MIESYGPIIWAARALSVSPKRRRRPLRGPAARRTGPGRWGEPLGQAVHRRFLRSLAFGVGALAIAIATPFASLAFVNDSEPSSAAAIVWNKDDGREAYLYLDAVDNGALGFGPTLNGTGQFSDTGPGVSEAVLIDGASAGTLATRAPSLPSFEQNFASEPLPESTPTPLTNEAIAPAAPVSPQPSAVPGPAALPAVQIFNVNLTFYSCLGEGFCGNMANGERVYEGAVACSYNLPLGTQLRILGDPTGRVYVCKDRGLLSDTWIDVFFYDPADGWAWQAVVGRYGTIEIISVP